MNLNADFKSSYQLYHLPLADTSWCASLPPQVSSHQVAPCHFQHCSWLFCTLSSWIPLADHTCYDVRLSVAYACISFIHIPKAWVQNHRCTPAWISQRILILSLLRIWWEHSCRVLQEPLPFLHTFAPPLV